MINISKEFIENSRLSDSTYAVNQSIFEAKEDETISFTKDDYKFTGQFAHEEFCFISNNDFGLKKIVFPIIKKKNLVIDGGGADFEFAGKIMPFYISECENITLRNFTIDYKRPFFTLAEVLEVEEKSVVVSIDIEKYPYRIVNDAIEFYGEDYTQRFVFGILAFDKEEKRPVLTAGDNSVRMHIKAQEIEQGTVRLFWKFDNPPKVGEVLSIKLDKRFVPGIAINQCKNIKLENIWIKQAGTMGVIAQFTENITIDNIKIAPDSDSGRLVSVNADATHFVGCTGTILVENSTFMNQLDDTINVHGNYLRVHKVLSPTNVIAEIPHNQQVGVYGISQGDAIGICDADSMLTEAVLNVEKIEVINKKYFNIHFKSGFEFKENQTYCLDNHDAYPEVIFRNNYSGKNRARSLLFSGAKKIIVENNIIESEGSICKISGDMTGWYESGRTTDIVIRKNKMSRRNEKRWGVALFDIDPEMTKHEENRYFHKNIVIEDNEITLNSCPFAFGQGIEKLTIQNNTFYTKTPEIQDDNLKFKLNDCGTIDVQNNSYVIEVKD